MDAIVEYIRAHFSKRLALFLTSLLPLIELKGAIPIGLAMGLGPWVSYLIAYLGSTLPAIPILLWIMPLFDYMKKKDFLKKYVEYSTERAERKKGDIEKKKYWGLFVFVAIPLPGTGVWMGSLIASLLSMNKLKSFVAIAAGNAVAGLIIYLFSSVFIG